MSTSSWARHDVLLCRVDRPGEGFHPIRPRSRPRRRPKRCLHHFVSHPAKEEGIGLVEVLDCVTMQVFVRQYCAMIAAPVQCDVDGIPKGSHYASVPPMEYARRERHAKLLLTLINAVPSKWTPPKTRCPVRRLIRSWELLRFHSTLEKSSDEVEDAKDDRHIGPASERSSFRPRV